MVKNIIFDLGGVILKHKANLIGTIFSQMFSVSKEEGLTLWYQYRVKLLKGDLSTKKLLEELRTTFKTNYTLPELLKMWKNLYIQNAQIDREVLDFASKLKNKYKVYLFTDTIDVHDEYNRGRNIYDVFTKVFKSFEEKLAKAEGKEFYLLVLKKIDAKPQECVFIDDLGQQVKRAESLGAKGIVFKNLPQLKEELSKFV